MSLVFLQSTSIFQQIWKILLLRLQIRVATNMLLADEDVWDARLASQFRKSALDLDTII